MARRASSRINPAYLIGAAAGIAVAIFAGKSLLGKKTATFGNVSKLSMEEYLENANQLRGSGYVVEGQIEEKLQWTSDRGQLISLKVETPGGNEFIGVNIPAGFNNLNIEAKQQYTFRVKILQSGVAVATGINRL